MNAGFTGYRTTSYRTVPSKDERAIGDPPDSCPDSTADTRSSHSETEYTVQRVYSCVCTHSTAPQTYYSVHKVTATSPTRLVSVGIFLYRRPYRARATAHARSHFTNLTRVESFTSFTREGLCARDVVGWRFSISRSCSRHS